MAALQKFAGGNNGTPQQQGQFFLQENPDLITALNNAKSVQEAQSLMNNAWAFKGYNVPGNAPMIAINDALGCSVVAETLSFRKER